MNMINPEPKKRGLKFYYSRIFLGAFITGIVIVSVIYTGQYFYSLQNSDENNGGGDGDDNGVVKNPPQFTWEIDAEGNATYIVDGDTYDTDSVGRIRLADIDTPDKNEPGYEVARDYLSSLIYNRHVYLDIDDVYGTDSYARVVTVTYVRYNDTHLLNVNKDLLEQGLAVIWNFYNEFTPSVWPLYVYYV